MQEPAFFMRSTLSVKSSPVGHEYQSLDKDMTLTAAFKNSPSLSLSWVEFLVFILFSDHESPIIIRFVHVHSLAIYAFYLPF